MPRTRDPDTSRPATKTEEHKQPAASGREASLPVLIAAFPGTAAVPVPEPGESVGRDWLARLGINDPKASGKHARLSLPGGVPHVEDLASRNGTFVDGHRLAAGERVALRNGAILRVGRTLLVYRNALQGDLSPATPLGGLVGPYGLRGVAAAVASLALRSVQNILIEGETGTGKELTARFIANQLRPSKPHIAINVAALSTELFEAQMFGHVARAFTGARDATLGVFREAEGGCVFLDEIGELSTSLQPKLLRVLENREVSPVGAPRPVGVDVVVIAATNRNLADDVTEGRFRRDLHARFLAGALTLPPLRERPEDIFAIVTELLRSTGTRLEADRIEVEAIERLMLLDLQSNVRDLQSIVTRAVADGPKGELTLRAVEQLTGDARLAASPPLTETAVTDALARSGGNQSLAARELGVDRGRLLRFLKGKRRAE